MAQVGPLPIEQLRALPGQMERYFSLEELRELAFNLHLDYENIPDDTKSAFARELVLALNRELRLSGLLEALNTQRPGIDWALEDVDRPAEPPYRGLEFYREEDAGLFFGRERLTTDLIARLRSHPFLAVVGASGSGKSSLVRAGVVPALKRGKKLTDDRTPPRGSASWAYLTLTPTARPLERLAVALTSDLSDTSDTATLAGDLRVSADRLRLAIGKYLERTGKPRVFLLVDQFEEVFTACKDEDERRAFIDGLFAAVGDQSTIVLTLRADFYHRCNPYPALRAALEQQQTYIGAPGPDELRAAIVEPSVRHGYELEEGLTDLMLRDVGDEPGTLPLLSHALLETWRRREGRTLTLDGYNRSGGVHGAIAHTAEEVFNDLAEPERMVMEKILIELTELGEGAEDTRRRVSRFELASHSWFRGEGEQVLELLVNARLATTDGDAVQISHEALIREWPRLREWLTVNRQGELLRRDLVEAARDWEANGQDNSYLIEGTRLAATREWTIANSDRMDARSVAFLAASVSQAERETREAEEARQRELESANALAAAESRRARTTRQFLYVAGVLAFLALAAAIYALNRSGEARLQADRAQQSLVTATVALLEADQARGTAEAEAARADLSLATAAAALATSESESLRADLNASEAEARAAEALNNAQLALTREAETIASVQLATSRELSMAALNTLANDPELSILLALQALKLAKTQQAGEALHTALQASRGLLSFDTGATGYYGTLMAANPEGDQLATAGENAVTLWDMSTGRALQALPLAQSTTSHHRLVFDEIGDNLTLVSASPDHTTVFVQSWLLGTAIEADINTITIPHDAATDIDINPEQTLLAVGRINRTAELWDIVEGQLVAILPTNDVSIADLTFNPSGKLLASTGTDGQVFLWDVATALSDPTPEPFARYRSPQSLSETGNLVNAEFVDDDTLVLGYLGQSEVLNLTDVENPHVTVIQSADLTRGYAINKAGTLLATAGQDGTGRIWNLETGELALILSQHPSPADDVLFSPDGRRLVTIDRDGLVREWDTSLLPLGEKSSLPVDRGVFDLDLSPDGQLIALGNVAGPASLWEAATGKRLHLLRGISGGVYRVAFSPDGHRVAGVGQDNYLHVWDVSSGIEVFSMPAHGEGVSGGLFPGTLDVAYSPDGMRLVTVGADGLGKVWNSETGQQVLTLEGHTDSLHSVAYSPDGRLIATTSDERDTSVRVWDAQSGDGIFTLTGHAIRVWGISFSPDSKYLLTGGGRGIIKLWDMATGEEIYTVQDEPDHIGSVAFTPNGEYFITTGETPLRVRRVSDGELMWTISKPILWSAKISNDGRWIYAADVNGMVRVLSLNLDDTIALAHDRLTRWWRTSECFTYLHTDDCPPAPGELDDN